MCADSINKRIDRCKADEAQFANPRLDMKECQFFIGKWLYMIHGNCFNNLSEMLSGYTRQNT
jgi:hypothetical protein